VGEVIGREQIERSNALNLNDVLRWSPRLSTSAATGNPTSRRSAGRCAPAYYVDGVELSPGGITTPDRRVAGAPLGGVITPDQVITARDVEAVEVYGEAGAPVTSTRSSGCGALMIWTRDTLPGGRTRRSNRQ
jgi:hypothetical protein